jgi:5-methylcytosine-specific restriction endonuclease McrA
MIKLYKCQKPTVLAENADMWTATVMAKIANGDSLNSTDDARYRHPAVKAALETETHGKCAYCESKLKHIHHADVEHIVPKSLAPELRYQWENLTLACEICNQNKSNKDPKTEFIIDPYVNDPSEHLTFFGTFLFPLGSKYGQNTKTLLDLNRVPLLVRRHDRLEKIMGIIDTILRDDLPMPTRKAIYNDLLSNEASPASEYSAMITSVIHSLKAKFPAEIL